MEEKKTSELVPGEIFAKPVYDDKGNCLVSAGAEATSALIRVLVRRGIEDVEIKSETDIAQDDVQSSADSARSEDPVIKQKLESMKEHLNVGFQHHADNVTMAVLYKSALDYMTAKISR